VMLRGAGERARSSDVPIALLLRGWVAYLPVGVLLVFSHDYRLVAPAVAAAGALAIFLHFKASHRLHQAGPLSFWSHAALTYLIAVGGCFLALQIWIAGDHPAVYRFFNLEGMQLKCWYCPSGWEETRGALAASLLIGLHVIVLSPASWRWARRRASRPSAA
jgi:hypothetical protein